MKQILKFLVIFLVLITSLNSLSAQSSDEIPMMLTVKIGNELTEKTPNDLLKINTVLQSIPAPKPLEVLGYESKTNSYVIFIKDYLVGQPVSETKAVYPYIRNQMLKSFPKATFGELHYTFSGQLIK